MRADHRLLLARPCWTSSKISWDGRHRAAGRVDADQHGLDRRVVAEAAQLLHGPLGVDAARPAADGPLHLHHADARAAGESRRLALHRPVGQGSRKPKKTRKSPPKMRADHRQRQPVAPRRRRRRHHRRRPSRRRPRRRRAAPQPRPGRGGGGGERLAAAAGAACGGSTGVVGSGSSGLDRVHAPRGNHAPPGARNWRPPGPQRKRAARRASRPGCSGSRLARDRRLLAPVELLHQVAEAGAAVALAGAGTRGSRPRRRRG